MAYTDIDDPSEYFQTAIYSGNSSTLAVTSQGNATIAPDWIWIKRRSSTSTHALFDSTRGRAKSLGSEATDAEFNTADTAKDLISFDTDGFTVGPANQRNTNGAGQTFVAWQWKANGGTTTSQTGSDINSVTQVNTDAGFSIVTYTSPSNADGDNQSNGGAYWRVKHGLGSVPKVGIFKSTSNVHAWYMWHHGFSGASKSDGDHIVLSTTSAMASDANILWGNTEWSSTEFEIGGWNVINRSGQSYIGYLFDEVQGYSKFGSYTGNADADGSFVNTGFKPAWLMVKRTDSSQNWVVYDNKRNDDSPAGANVIDRLLYPNANDAEVDTGGSLMVDFLSNGFKMRGNHAASNGAGHHIYMAFAESPFVSSTGTPTTAR